MGGNESSPDVLLVDDLPDLAVDVLYVLVSPDSEPAAGLPELWRTPRGVAAVTYTSLTNLVAACGGGQPWERIGPDRLRRWANTLGFTLVVVDVWLPAGHRYAEPDPAGQPDLRLLPEAGDGSLVYVPSRPVHEGDRTVDLELQPDDHGRPMMLAYTTPERLGEGCGEHQPWVAIRSVELDRVAEEAGAAGVLFNPELGESSRHKAPVRDWTRVEAPEDDWSDDQPWRG